jgi:hypothetical protein
MYSLVTESNPGRPGFFLAFGPVFLVVAVVGFCFLLLGAGLWLVLSLLEGSPTIS